MFIDTTSGDFDYTYLSLGAGVQSSALLVLACTDKRIPKPDAAIFADTGDEPPWVYEYVKILTEWAKQYDVDVVTAQKAVLSQWVLDRKQEGKLFVNIPLYTVNEDKSQGHLRRQCTREFKIAPITKKVRELLGYEPRKRVKHNVRAMLGISADETQRMKPSRFKWVTNTFPLVDLGIRREDCYKIVTDVGLPKPEKSACVYCPYHDNGWWSWIKKEHPEEFAKAVDFDHAVREMTMRGGEQLGYIHSSCQPLDEVEFKEADPNQVDMFSNECEGMCGV